MYDGLTLVNLTPHALVISRDGDTLVVAPSGEVARVATETVEVSTGFYEVHYGEVVNLPEPKEGTIYIVSGLVLSGLAGSRSDVYAPATALAARNELGHIVSVPGLVR